MHDPPRDASMHASVSLTEIKSEVGRRKVTIEKRVQIGNCGLEVSKEGND